jgi:predicted nucleic-acid-binding protein
LIGLDTNVLVRILVRDDPGQTALAERLIGEAAETGEPCFISDLVLCEIEWVLDSVYKVKRPDILGALQELYAREIFVFEDRQILRGAIDAYQHGKAELSDYLIGAKGQAKGARTTYTFDRPLSQQEGFSLLR